MRHLLLLLAFTSSLANAQLSDDMLAILALDEPAKSEAIAAKRIEFVEAVPQPMLPILCRNAAVSTAGNFTRFVDMIKDRSPSPIYENMSYGEFAFFVDCDGHNAFEHNVFPTNLQGTAIDGISPLTRHMIKEMGLLLREKGPSGLTPIAFVTRLIIAANDVDNFDLAITYNQVRIAIEARIRELEAEQ